MNLEERVREGLRQAVAGIQSDDQAWGRLDRGLQNPRRQGGSVRRWGSAVVALAVAAAGIGFAIQRLSGAVRAGGHGSGGGIAFVKAGPKQGPGVDNTDIYLLGDDGRLRNLTDDPAAESSPAWSPDGSRVAFVRTSFSEGRLRTGIYVMNGDGTGMREVRACPDQRCFRSDLAWSPDGSRIAFVEDASQGETPFNALEVMDPDGSHVQVLCGSLDACGQGVAEPAWSPDGARLAFSNEGVSAFSGGGLLPSFIHVVNADGTGLRKLTGRTCHIGHDPIGSCPFFDTATRWSPDGGWIAFSRHLAGRPLEPLQPGFAHGSDTQIVLIRPDGSGLRPLATCRLDVYCEQVMVPAWSPDGHSIGYVPAVEKHPEIRIVSITDGRERAIRTCAEGCVDPYDVTWSPDGTQLAFQGSGRLPSLYIMASDGSGMHALVQGIEDDAIAWLPSNGRAASSIRPAPGISGPVGLTTESPPLVPGLIAFSHYTDDNEDASDIYTVHSDGSDLVRLTSNPDTDSGPAWSPDGNRIAFESYRVGSRNTNVWTMNADGSGQLPLTTFSGGATQAAWSPDGTRIAFSAGGAGPGTAIFLMNADGSNARQITDSSNGDMDPAWSPNGTLIAFTRASSTGGTGIYVITPDGTGLREVTHLPGSAEQPAWSPDGSRFAFEWNTAAGNDLYVINADGTGLRRLTSLPGGTASPTWSPDGSRIAFAYTDTAFRGAIYTIAADGTGLARVVGGNGAYLDPSWQPAG
jgi:Tol biopolymer transport system component